MPLYEIEHICPLSPSQKDALAASITQIHSHLFTTPSLFVNVRFTDISNQDVYVGGKKKPTNRILAHVRPGGGRSTADFNTLCERITESWNHILSPPTETEEGSPPTEMEEGGSSNEEKRGEERYRDEERDGKGEGERERELRAIFVLGTIVAGREVGFELPAAGNDKQWLTENAGSFRQLAENGDEDFKELVREMEEREDLSACWWGGG